MTDFTGKKEAVVLSSLRTREEHVPTTGEEAISAYLAWRRRHQAEPDGNGRTLVRLIPAQRRSAGTPG